LIRRASAALSLRHFVHDIFFTQEFIMSNNISNLVDGANSQLNSALGAIGSLPSSDDPNFTKKLMEAQLQMHMAQTSVTATSEVIKAWGEGQKGIAKNMSI
jgi:hypothetical protein